MVLLVVLALGACQRIQPVYSVQGHAVPAASASLAPDQIMQLIVSTAQSKGWLIEPIGPTQVRASQKWRTHSATVIITTAFKDALDLQFKGKGMPDHPCVELPHPVNYLSREELRAIVSARVSELVQQVTA